MKDEVNEALLDGYDVLRRYRKLENDTSKLEEINQKVKEYKESSKKLKGKENKSMNEEAIKRKEDMEMLIGSYAENIQNAVEEQRLHAVPGSDEWKSLQTTIEELSKCHLETLKAYQEAFPEEMEPKTFWEKVKNVLKNVDQRAAATIFCAVFGGILGILQMRWSYVMQRDEGFIFKPNESGQLPIWKLIFH